MGQAAWAKLIPSSFNFAFRVSGFDVCFNLVCVMIDFLGNLLAADNYLNFG